ncbi:DUF4406 domain-containing protein [Paraburkholderia agricolaris]|uniref:DUF4406 domain-containing protein n=1 Tax=Paraburkholderia agricolaris TaxID=2152888 RepID=UPI001292A36D|nr:DUF4406 domain-containing protein [Paraburkholderia agricolaris]
MKLYLAGPMTGYPELNFPLFHAEAARLRALGFEIVNPAELNDGNDDDWLACMRVDIKAAVDCDGVALLPGWEHSRGAPIEHRLLRDLGLRVFQATHIINLVCDMPVLSDRALIALIDAEAV